MLLRIATFVIAGWWMLPGAWAEPARVIIIRHGEKPEQGHDLNTRGRERAAALVPLLTDDGGPGKPTVLFAQEPNGDHGSRRPLETITPLAKSLGLKVWQYDHDEVAAMAKEILKSPKYQGGTVLICWSHHGIPDIAKALGVQSPPKWRDEIYDRFWVITFSDGKAMLSNRPQRLLFEDSEK